ncbi:16S rRNA (guanine(966)-N(2))-methyltransferase RsmD [Eubacteriaceae bacterium ES3]|nr:16S rRNA (guanine(966)-N(2))-methyltransferase RsmD [Eubacteriaceae bacterium ES3]
MRIIGGDKRGTKLVPVSSQGIRPTSDKIRGAIFNSLQFEIHELEIFVDLFAGTGAMGIEALSRGVKKAYFFDISEKSLQIVKKNVDKVGYNERSELVHISAEDGINLLKDSQIEVDLMFLDPPYVQGDSIDKLLDLIESKEILSKGGKIVIETEKSVIMPLEKNTLFCYKKKTYGNTLVYFYVKETNEF